MLSLDQTALLLDGLKPPPGMQVDIAVGTTFTLDLTALLAIPVAASLASDDTDSADLLEVVRRHAERTILFSQAGAISVPPKYRAALTFVEQSVVEVKRPTGGIFHPKVWAVRFSGPGGSLHRVLVMSRNLTFDRSWDVVVRLDEDDAPRKSMDAAGVVELLQHLPTRSARGLSDTQLAMVQDLADTLAGARLAVPEPFDSGSFVPLLGRRDGQPFRRRCDHALAISPFLSDDATRSFLRTASSWSGIVSRPAALDATAQALRDAERVLRLKDAVLEAERTIDDTFDSAGDATPDDGFGDAGLPRGLHAKIYVQDHGDRASCWIGSANLTAGAFSTNVEMLVRLSGSVRDVGVDALLSPTPRKDNLSWFLEDHPLPEQGPDADLDEEVGELDASALDLASGEVTLRLEPAGDHWDAELTIDPWQPPDGLSIRARLLSLGSDATVEVDDGRATWTSIPLDLVTPFIVLEAHSGGLTRRALVRAHLVGDPEDRRRSVIANAIASREDFLRYLAALLGVELGFGAGGAADGFLAGGWVGGSAAGRVLEDLLLTASRHPARLSSLDDTLQQLQRRPDVAQIVPDDFRQLWAAVYASRKGSIHG